MSDRDHVRDAVIRGLDPVMEQAPGHPEWDSLQFEKPRSRPGAGRGWEAAVAAVVVLVVGVAVLLQTGVGGTGADEDRLVGGPSVAETRAAETQIIEGHSIAGVWILESYELNDQKIFVEPGVNTGRTPWLEFHETFSGTRETFASADGEGTAGTFTGDTGCNKINYGHDVGYEFSAGFLVLEELTVESGECGYEAERVLLAVLGSEPGLETMRSGDTMELHGELYRTGSPLTFRREGAALIPPTEDEPSSIEPPLIKRTATVFDLDGLEVVVMTELEELPGRAERVEFTGTIIDSGAGPELCLGGVAESLPPQCSGPVIDGLDMSGWSEEAQGVRWGDRRVVVTWPPVDGHIQLLEESEPKYERLVYPPGVLPAECAGIRHFVGPGQINEYAQGLGASSGGVYLTNEGQIVLQVVGSPQEHRDALASDGREACVIEVSRSATEQRAILEAIAPRLADLVGGLSVSTGPGGRVEVNVAVADSHTAEAIAGLVDDRTAIRVVGWGILLP